MAQLDPNCPYQSWILSDEEVGRGSILTGLQKQCIQNQIVQLLLRRANIVVNAESFPKFIQEEADLKGQTIALQYLLTLSAEAEKQYDRGAVPTHIVDSPDPSGSSDLPYHYQSQ